ncbi:MAG: transposase [Pseudomonadota bacterium]
MAQASYRIGVAGSHLIVTEKLTGNDCGEDKQVRELLDGYAGAVKRVSGDGAYDSHAVFDEITRRGAQALIPTQANLKHKRKRLEDIQRPRDEVAWLIQERGRGKWKAEGGYHRRSLVETAFYRYKQLLGSKLKARLFENQRVEALISCHALNKMTLLGMPESVAL